MKEKRKKEKEEEEEKEYAWRYDSLQTLISLI